MKIINLIVACLWLSRSACLASAAPGTRPFAAAVFNQSIGVNTHLNFRRSRYNVDYDKWIPLLLRSRIKHVRDGFCNWGTASSFCANTWSTRFNRLALAGIKFDIVTDPWMGWTAGETGCHGTCLYGYPAALHLISSAIEAYEGPNECDRGSVDCRWLGTASGLNSEYVLARWSVLIWLLHGPATSIFSPAMAASESYGNYAYLGNYTNFCAVHDEVNGAQTPEYSMDQYFRNFQAGCASFVGSEPIVGTESDGWNTDTTTLCKNGSVDQLAEERYFPRDLLLHIQKGVRIYSYELLDENASGSCSQYGFIDLDFRPKLVWRRIGQLMSYFSDDRASRRTPLSFALSGDSTGTMRDVLFQKSDGTYILAAWLGTKLWDQTTKLDYEPVRETLMLRLPPSVRSLRLTMFLDRGAVALTRRRSANGVFFVPVSSLVEGISFRSSRRSSRNR